MPQIEIERSTNGHTDNILSTSALPWMWDNNFFSTDPAPDFDDDILMDLDLDWTSFVQLDYDLNCNDPHVGSPRYTRGPDDSNSGFRPRGPSVREFFSQSLWLWDPDARDSASTEETPHLSEADERVILSTVHVNNASTDKGTGLSPWSAGFSCRSDTRDALLLMVQSNSARTSAVRCFPSAEVLNFLLKAFAFQEALSRCSLLHLPSFKGDSCKIELLSGLIIAGSTSFSNPQIWKLGLALQDPTRIALYKVLDRQALTWQNMELLQAQILWIEAGLWSGVRCNMEVAESAANSIPTMIRRTGVYNLMSLENTWVPLPQDDDNTLKSKWAKWTQLESFRRCVIRAFINDIQASAAYARSPRFYSTEIMFGLPSAHDLWNAPDHLTWTTALLAKRTGTEQFKLTLRDIFQDPSTLRSLSREYDRELCAFSALHCLWPQIVALQDSKSLHRGHRSNKRPSQNSLWLEAQRQDLYQRLADIRDTSSVMGILTCEARVVCEIFMMALYVSFVDIEKLVGRFGLDESRLTTPNLRTWSDSDEPWHAMWHAGQVLKAAQDMKPSQLRGFYAVAVYQACIVLALPFMLEAISKTSRRQSPEPQNDAQAGCEQHTHNRQEIPRPREETNLVVLNGEENMQVRMYLLNGHGRPSLILGNEVTPLSDISVVPLIISKILESNHGTGADRLPPMSEKLVALVKELTKLTGH
ncbi:hypothetical protein PV08_07965 [Exophiala spinifera]|uniref:Transcription factor domain-containing protein n=1 Tax=Exophiala spinifera TaxID=91928 RepID=A0A0D2B1G9_9EURO|nr:uncharacterized protein PV08_07965 [Exophiala spinifera]KIW12778.1 hypothetical protein PV08_07965 [Exophiala spinifera]